MSHRSFLVPIFVTIAAWFFAACNPEVEGPQSCDVDSQCPVGRYCGADGFCTFDCIEDEDCRDPEMGCTHRGMCAPRAIDGGVDADADADADADTEDPCEGVTCEISAPVPDDACADCGGASADWGEPLWAHRGVCVYSNGAGREGLEPCDASSTTGDGQVPLLCRDDGFVTSFGEAAPPSAPFQSAEWVRRLGAHLQAGWGHLIALPCAWWDEAPASAGMVSYVNGGREAPQIDDVVVFSASTEAGGPCDVESPGHLATIGQIDLTREVVVLHDQNRGDHPLEATFERIDDTWTIHSPFEGLEVRGWLRGGAGTVHSCGVRTVLHSDDDRGDERWSQLVGCPPGDFCNVERELCEPIVPVPDCATRPSDCPAGTRCDGTRCVCDDSQSIDARGWVFDDSTECWRPGDWVRDGDGCRASIGVDRGPDDRPALLVRDLDVRGGSIRSPRLAWTTTGDEVLRIDGICEGADGAPVRVAASLSPPGDAPDFDAAGLHLGPTSMPCDGTRHLVELPLDGVAAATPVGWLRLELGVGGELPDLRLWIASIDLGPAVACGREGQPCCDGSGCLEGRCVGGVCEPCGGLGESCCEGGVCDAGLCVDEVCVSCGGVGEPCCEGGACDSGLCVDGACVDCGGAGEPCCEGGACEGDAVCTDGTCDGPCVSECPALGIRECIDAERFRECADRDSDGCREWAAPTACGAGMRCDSGACVSCGHDGEPCCAGGSCDGGLTCSGTHCEPGCTDDCSFDGQAECLTATTRRTCGEYDADTCLDWSGSLSCGASRICTGAGVCEDCGGSGEPCCAGGSCDGGLTCSGGTCTLVCGGSGEPCCAGRTCDGSLVCLNASDTCGTDSTPTTTVYRFVSLCTSAHWHAVGNQCYPSSSGPTTGCDCGSRTINAGCGAADSTCWDREISFHSYFFDPTYGDFFRVHHCFEGGGNRYSDTGCASYGDPTYLGWFARSPEGLATLAVYLCQWSASGVMEQFFVTSAAECTAAGGTVLAPSPWGYVIP